MNEQEKDIRKQIIKSCKRLHERNLLAAADGNVSYRINDERILITPSGMPKAFIEKEDIAVINLEGDILEGTPSSEKHMHLEIYRSCSDAKAVVHAHPPHAIAWTIANPESEKLPSECLPEVILAAGEIPIVPYVRPGTQEMGEILTDFLPQRRAFILSRHGAVCWGEDIIEAYGGMERIEHSAYMLTIAKQLGGLTYLSEVEVDELKLLRQELGERLL